MIIKSIPVAVHSYIGFRVPKIQRLLQRRKKIRFFGFIFSHPLHTHAAHSHHAIRIHSHAWHTHAVGHHSRHHPGHHSKHTHSKHAHVILGHQFLSDLSAAKCLCQVGRYEAKPVLFGAGEFREFYSDIDHLTAADGGHEMHYRVPVRIGPHQCPSFLWLGGILFFFALHARHTERIAHAIGIQTGHHSRRHPR